MYFVLVSAINPKMPILGSVLNSEGATFHVDVFEQHEAAQQCREDISEDGVQAKVVGLTTAEMRAWILKCRDEHQVVSVGPRGFGAGDGSSVPVADFLRDFLPHAPDN